MTWGLSVVPSGTFEMILEHLRSWKKPSWVLPRLELCWALSLVGQYQICYIPFSLTILSIIVLSCNAQHGDSRLRAKCGPVAGGALMLHYGRRRAIALDSFFYTVGPLLMAFAPHASILLAGRILVGIGIGMSAVVAPTYLGEIAPARMRGRIVESYEVLLCFGMLASVAMDVAFGHLPHNWRWMVGPMLLLDSSVA